MIFEKNLVYHVFNQGNNREQVFFNEENYLFFLTKMRVHLLPHAELLCYCLMPNHFHWLIQVVEPELIIHEKDLTVARGNPHLRLRSAPDSYDDCEPSYESGADVKPKSSSESPPESYDDSKSSYDSGGDSEGSGSKAAQRIRSLNDSIAILLRSYTRAINVQEKRTGSLFRAHTQGKTGWIDQFITVDRYRKGTFDFRAFPDDEYGYHCFNYIHDNPSEAGLCANATDWPYSSARDFAGLRNGTLCNQELAKSLLRLPP